MAKPTATSSHSAPAFRRVWTRGMALAFVMLAVAVCVVLGTLFVLTASTSAQITQASDERLRARMIAESGLDIARAYVDDNPSWRTSRANGVWVSSQPFGGGSFTLRGEDGDRLDASGAVVGDGSLSDDTRDPVTLTSVGTYGRHKYLVRATLTPSGGSTFAVSERVTIRGGAVLDSYSSRVGAYGGSNVGQNAVVSSNATAQPHVTLQDSARVNGDLYVGPGADPAWAVKVLGSAVVTGTRSTLPAAVAFPTLAEPSLGASSGDVSYSSHSVTTLAADLHCNHLSVTGGHTLKVPAGRNVVVDGDLYVSGGASIQVVPSAYGAAVKTTVEVLDSAAIDSYDSSGGAYGGANAGSAAAVATNATAAGSISVTGGSIKGSATSGAGSNPAGAISTSSGGTITGARSALAAALSIPAPPAWPGTVPANSGTYAKSSGVSTISANLQVDSFQLTGTATVRISGHRVIRVNKEFVVDNTAKLEIMTNSSLQLYVQEYVKVSASAVVNDNTQDPTLLTIYARGSGYEHTILNDARVHAVLDSPDSSLKISHDAQLFGAFMGQSLRMDVRGRLHHDRSPNVLVANPRMQAVSEPATFYTKGAVTFAGPTTVNADTADAAKLLFNHLSDSAFTVKAVTTVYATVVAPDASFEILDGAVFHGTAKARHLKMTTHSTATVDASGGTANPGLLVRESISLSGTTVLSGLNGPAVLASNACSTLAVSIEDTSAVKGSAYSGPGGKPAWDIYRDPAAQLTGTAGSLSAAAAIALPTFPTLSTSNPNRSYTGSGTFTLNGNVNCNTFTIGDNAIVQIDGNVTVAAAGAVTIKDAGQLRLSPGAQLTIYCESTVDVLNDGRLNADGDHTRVVINNRGTASLSLQNNAKVAATILAPSAQLKCEDNAHLFGSFKGKRLKVQDLAQVHYDEAGPPRVAWIEQQ